MPLAPLNNEGNEEKEVKSAFNRTTDAIRNLQSVELPISEELQKVGREFSEEALKIPPKVQSQVAQPSKEQSRSKSRTNPSQEEQEDV